MKRFSAELNNSLFNELLLHLTCCAKDFRTRMQFESRRILLNEVFANCDNSCVCTQSVDAADQWIYY